VNLNGSPGPPGDVACQLVGQVADAAMTVISGASGRVEAVIQVEAIAGRGCNFVPAPSVIPSSIDS
jgi:hypothetical protein